MGGFNEESAHHTSFTTGVVSSGVLKMAYKEKPFIDEEFGDELNAEKVVGGFLKGVLTVAGVALMAVIAGYSAGIAQENYRASRAKASGLDSARSQR